MRRSAAIAGLVGVAVIAAAALLYANHAGVFKADDPLRPLAVGAMAKLQVSRDPAAAPDYVFTDPQGRPTRLTDLRGKPTVVNVWAMWCAPCKEEMPTLAALAKTEGDRIRVVTVNVDHDPAQAEAGRAFLAGLGDLPFYTDARFQLPFELPGKGGMPQTVLLDAEGRVRAHLTGAADWSSPETRALIDALVREQDET